MLKAILTKGNKHVFSPSLRLSQLLPHIHHLPGSRPVLGAFPSAMLFLKCQNVEPNKLFS